MALQCNHVFAPRLPLQRAAQTLLVGPAEKIVSNFARTRLDTALSWAEPYLTTVTTSFPVWRGANGPTEGDFLHTFGAPNLCASLRTSELVAQEVVLVRGPARERVADTHAHHRVALALHVLSLHDGHAGALLDPSSLPPQPSATRCIEGRRKNALYIRPM